MSGPVDVPAVPTFDGDYRVQSAPVLIQTNGGDWYTARWTVYEDADFASVWELIGRDGVQLERGDVAAWFECAAVAELIAASARTVLAFSALGRTRDVVAQLESHRECEAALVAQKNAMARIGGAP